MTVAPQATETVYALAGANLGPFASIWICGDLTEVSVVLSLGGVSTILNVGPDFTVAGASPLTTGLQVTLQASVRPGGAWPANSSVALRRVTANGQASAFGEALGFSPSASEQALDVIARQVQECEQRIGRSLRAQPGEHFDPIPDALGRATAVLAFDAAGVPDVTLLYQKNAHLMPTSSGDVTLGGPANRWSTVYATVGAINVSDARAKMTLEPIPDAVLDAWADVDFMQFRLIEQVERYGDDAPVHVGVIAQQIIASFEARGLDALAYGVVTHDRWEDGEDRMAGDIYGVRYDQAMVLEAALMRRELRRRHGDFHGGR